MKEEINKRMAERERLFCEMQKLIDELTDKYHALLDHDLKTYHQLQKPDCLYGDSPISRSFTTEWMRQYFVKKDVNWGYVLDGKESIRSFVDRCREASKWALRFTKPAPPEKKGLDAIL